MEVAGKKIKENKKGGGNREGEKASMHHPRRKERFRRKRGDTKRKGLRGENVGGKKSSREGCSFAQGLSAAGGSVIR